MSLELSRVVTVLERLAPLELAASWDNVGLLVEAPQLDPVDRVLLTIDLTPAVLDEALELSANLVVAYHPPIFTPLRRLTCSVPGERTILRAAAAGVAIYSPHTALDAVPGGVNDWLAGAFDATSIDVIEPANPEGAPPGAGQGRLLRLRRAASVDELLAVVKAHLGVASLRLARAAGGVEVRSIALCPGAGASVLAGVEADLWLTGEMRHHDVLAANARGTHVVLGEHTNTERGYLDVLRARLEEALGADAEVEVRVSQLDRDPLESC